MAMSITVDAEFINEAIIEKIQTTSTIDLSGSTVNITMTRTGAGANATIEIPSAKKKIATLVSYRSSEEQNSDVQEETVAREEETEESTAFSFNNTL